MEDIEEGMEESIKKMCMPLLSSRYE
jgi:hypothetical protein